jgi:hypothetical protein
METKFSLSSLGSRERFVAGEILIAWSNEAWASPEDHLEDGVSLEFNPNSGYVFLVDEDFNVAMLNDDGKLENWLYCGDCGKEGFRSEVNFSDDGLCSHCHLKMNLNYDEFLVQLATA